MIAVTLALLALHVVTSMRYGPWGDTPWSGTWWMINPDLLLVLALGCLMVSRSGFRMLIGHACVFAILCVPLYRIQLVVTQAYFRSEPRLLENLEYVWGSWVLITSGHSAAAQTGIILGIILGVAVAWTALYLCLRVVLRKASQRKFAIGLLAFTQMFALAGWAESSARPDDDSRIAGPSMFASLAREGLGLLRKGALEAKVDAVTGELARFSKQMTGLGGADVHVLFVESYGRILFAHPKYRSEVVSLCQRWQRDLQAQGYQSRTSYTRAPSYGGRSQAAHATLLSGVTVESYRELRELERTSATTLARILADVGYVTINAQPKLDREWPASADYYGFTKDLFGKDLPYVEGGGFRYPWAPSPDQYCLQFALDRLIRSSSKPVFMQFVSATSHVPFNAIPPYHEDWAKAADPKAHQPVATYDLSQLNYATAPDKDEAFVRSIVYSLNTAFGFVSQLQRPSLVFILGDHQPARVCEIPGREPTWDVPIHVLTNRPNLLAPLEKRGFVGGLVPTDSKSFEMREFLARFLGDYGR